MILISRAEDLEICTVLLYLGNVSKNLLIQKRLGYIDMFIIFSVDYCMNNVDGALDIHKYLIAKSKTKWWLKYLLHY